MPQWKVFYGKSREGCVATAKPYNQKIFECIIDLEKIGGQKSNEKTTCHIHDKSAQRKVAHAPNLLCKTGNQKAQHASKSAANKYKKQVSHDAKL